MLPQACLMLAAGLNSSTHSLDVRVAAWNVYDLPEQAFHVQSSIRMQQVADALKKVCSPIDTLDAVVFTELYVKQDKKVVLEHMRLSGLKHVAELNGPAVLDKLRFRGVVVVSRWPIVKQASKIFDNACHGLDCFVAKGSLYVRLDKTVGQMSHPVNLFATHFYLGKSNAQLRSRHHQAQAVAGFIREQGIVQGEPVIVAGDLNAPWHCDGPEVLRTMGAFATQPSGALDHTFVGRGHPLSGSPWQSVKQRCQQLHDKVPPNQQRGRKWIDYVVAVAPGPQPLLTRLSAQWVTSVPYKIRSATGDTCQLNALSDHHPVLGELSYGW